MGEKLKLPLRIEDDYIVDADGNDVADCGQSHVRPSDAECAAFLVNAANNCGALLAACEALLETAHEVVWIHKRDEPCKCPTCARHQAIRVIAKARGEAE